jgi:hypothetical protein
MRTTININEHLLQMAKRRALETNRTLTSVFEDALRLALDVKSGATNRRITIPVSGAGGLQSGVDLDDNASLLDRMEDRT